jgi:ABC-type glycerol-3-phosphate transport system substrate-binding protein
MLQSSLGDIPFDLFLGPGNYSVEKYHRRDLAIPLDDLLGEEVLGRIFPGMLAASRAEGKTYLLPFMGEVEVLNFRTDLFEKAGFENPPETWEEFEQFADRLTDQEKQKYGISIILGGRFFFYQNAYVPLLRSFGGTAVGSDGHVDLSSRAAHKTFRTLKRWWKKGLISPACKTKSGAPDDFTSGITAMFPNWQSRGLWALRRGTMTGKIGFAPLPGSKKVGSLFAVHGAMILKGSTMQKESALYLKEVVLGYAQKDIIAAGKMAVTGDAYTPDRMPEWMIEVGKTLSNGYTLPEPMLTQEVSEYVCVAFEEYLDSDSDDPAPFLEKANREINQRIYSRQE